MNRVTTLDYLRGICAFAIMVYHYVEFSGLSHLESADFLGRVGRYGVSIFYILSGLTLYLVYNQKFNLKHFYIRRIFRIYPLLIIVITVSILIHSIEPSWKTLFLNYTGLFGVVKPWDYIGTGVWSIGNELFFYLLFPLLIICARQRLSLILISVVIFIIYAYFAFEALDPGITLAKQWRIYVNPLNQMGLFFIGFLIGHFFQHIMMSQPVASFLLLIAIVSFILWPARGDTINLVSGFNRIIFTIIGAVVCLSFYKLNYRIPIVHDFLVFLGESSYSVYLLHPIIWFMVSTSPIQFTAVIIIPLCIVLTLIASYLVYTYYEKPLMTLGKRLSTTKKYETV